MIDNLEIIKNNNKIIIVILMAVIILLIGYIVYDKVFNKQVNNLINEEEKNNLNKEATNTTDTIMYSDQFSEDGTWMMEALPLYQDKNGVNYGFYGHPDQSKHLLFTNLKSKGDTFLYLYPSYPNKTVPNIATTKWVKSDAENCERIFEKQELYFDNIKVLSLENGLMFNGVALFDTNYFVVTHQQNCDDDAGAAIILDSNYKIIYKFNVRKKEYIYAIDNALYYHECMLDCEKGNSKVSFYRIVVENGVAIQKKYKEQNMLCHNDGGECL